MSNNNQDNNNNQEKSNKYHGSYSGKKVFFGKSKWDSKSRFDKNKKFSPKPVKKWEGPPETLPNAYNKIEFLKYHSTSESPFEKDFLTDITCASIIPLSMLPISQQVKNTFHLFLKKKKKKSPLFHLNMK